VTTAIFPPAMIFSPRFPPEEVYIMCMPPLTEMLAPVM
jgi:hypothetical protein